MSYIIPGINMPIEIDDTEYDNFGFKIEKEEEECICSGDSQKVE